jgi:hypothetical protein
MSGSASSSEMLTVGAGGDGVASLATPAVVSGTGDARRCEKKNASARPVATMSPVMTRNGVSRARSDQFGAAGGVVVSRGRDSFLGFGRTGLLGRDHSARSRTERGLPHVDIFMS